MCNYFNNYDNLKGCMLIKFGLHLYEKCITYLSGKFSKLYSNVKKVTMVSKDTFIQIS